MKKRIFGSLLVLVIGLFVPANSFAFSVAPTPQTREMVEYQISPGLFERDKDYTVVIRDPRCTNQTGVAPDNPTLEKATILDSNGIQVVRIIGSSPCTITAKIHVEADAQFSTLPLPILDSSGKVLGYCQFTVMARTPGPIPPGLEKPQVDLLWSVMPDKLVDDAFGERVRKRYYGIEVVIGNNSGYDLQIASVGFELSGEVIRELNLNSPDTPWDNRLSSSGYRFVRAAIEKTQEVGSRNRAIFLLETAAGIGAGGIPFFRNANPRANYSTIVSIFSNPLLTGLKLIFPDRTLNQFTRLDDLALRSDFIISNNTQARRVVFFPKEVLCEYFKKVAPTRKCDKQPALEVMKALGNLVLVGQQIRYENRIRVVSTPLEKDGPGGNTALKSSRVTFQQGEKGSLTLNGTGLRANDLSASSQGIKLSNAKASPDGTALTVEIEVGEDVPVGEQKILVATASGFLASPIRITQKPVISGLLFGDGSPTIAIDAIKAGTLITVTGKNLQNVTPSILDSNGEIAGTISDISSSTPTKLTFRWKFPTVKSGATYTISFQVTPNVTVPETKKFTVQ